MSEDQAPPPMQGSHWEASLADAKGAWGQKRRLADAMRRVIALLITSDAPEDELATAAERLEAYAEHLATHPQKTKYEGFAESANAGDVGAFFDVSPVIGRSNPVAPPVTMHAVSDTAVRGHANFGVSYEGPPGYVHGGWVAAAFDEVLGFAQSLSGKPGMTGTLTIRYRKPTPLHTDLRFEGGIDRIDGRKIFASGQVFAGEVLTAEAEGIFVSIDPERYRSLLDARNEGA